MFATLVVAILPWWLFAGLTYRRKYIIGAMLTGLALGYVRPFFDFSRPISITLTYTSSGLWLTMAREVAFAALRLRGLYKSAHSYADLTCESGPASSTPPKGLVELRRTAG